MKEERDYVEWLKGQENKQSTKSAMSMVSKALKTFRIYSSLFSLSAELTQFKNSVVGNLKVTSLVIYSFNLLFLSVTALDYQLFIFYGFSLWDSILLLE